MYLTMMDIYACAAMLHKAEELSDTAFPESAETYCMLIKTYGNTDNAPDATRLLNKLLDSENLVLPTTQMFNMVLDAWAKSSAVTALYRAYEVFNTFDKHPKCIQHNIRRDIITYGSILKCIVAADVPQGPDKAEEILSEMETKYQKHLSENPDSPEGCPDVVKPDKIIYTLVMKAWFQAGESDRALAVVKRMEDNAGILPDRRMYNEMLQHFAKVGTDDAATSANRILIALKQKMKPDFYSYSLLCKTWLKSGDPEALDRLWDIYEEMRAENIHPDKFLFLQFVQSLTASKQPPYIQKAELILNELEKGPKGFLSPTHYSMIFMAYLDIGDGDRAVEILTRFVYTFGQVDGPFTAIINQLTKLWIKKGDIKKATFLVNTMQEFFNTGMLMQGPSRDTYLSLRNAWLASDDPTKDHIADQIQSILLNFPSADDDAADSSTDAPKQNSLSFIRNELAVAMGPEADPSDNTSNCDPYQIDGEANDVFSAPSDDSSDAAIQADPAGTDRNADRALHDYHTGKPE
jgi:pentatricopeptide repeat protein